LRSDVESLLIVPMLYRLSPFSAKMLGNLLRSDVESLLTRDVA